MQNKLLVNVTPIRYPLTGIGYYTLNILLELLSRDIDVVGIKNGTVLDSTELRALAFSYINQSDKKQPSQNRKRFIIEALRSIPGIYQAKNILLSMKAKRSLLRLAEEGYIYFEPSFVPFRYKGHIIT